MTKTETMEIAGREFTAKSLSIGEIDNILKEVENMTPDLIDHLFEDGIDSSIFYRSLEITIDDIGDLSLDEVGELMSMVARVNPQYARMEKRFRSRLREMLNTALNLASSCNLEDMKK
jgi:hypothetical protein